MTLLMFEVNRDSAFVVTDTVAVDEHDVPAGFRTKFVVLPHAEVVVACTGIANFLPMWAHAANQTAAVDIDSLHERARLLMPQMWSQLAARFKEEKPDDEDLLHSTIYHIGRSRERGYTAYAYRIDQGFAGEELAPGFYFKPVAPVTEAPRPFTGWDRLEPWTDIAEAVRAHAAANEDDREHPIVIGGELVGAFMAGGGTMVRKFHHFDTYDEDWQAIHARPRFPK